MKQYVQFSGATQPLHEVETNGDYYKVTEVDELIDELKSDVHRARNDAQEIVSKSAGTYTREILRLRNAIKASAPWESCSDHTKNCHKNCNDHMCSPLVKAMTTDMNIGVDNAES